jgi:hypothetical protein
MNLQEPLMQIGIGGVFALLIIREVLTFLKAKKGNGGAAGERTVEYWQQQFGVIVDHSINTNMKGRIDSLRAGHLELLAELKNAQLAAIETTTRMIGLLERIERLLDRRVGNL